MGFVKVVKNSAYFKRFEVKYKRRRQCKTDYYARKKMIIQDKNKYGTRKYRMVVRFTNRDIIVQVFSAELDKDRCLATAYSHELQNYGVKVGLKGYAAAYATGLLLARRVNAKLKIDLEGQTEIDGELFNVEDSYDERRPFKAILDVGLNRTTVGARLFGALKGACDGGINVPHNEKRFPGSSKDENGEYSYDPEVHRSKIFGEHVAAYMAKLKEEDEAKYQAQFSQYIKAGVTSDKVAQMWTDCHAAIRADPSKARPAGMKGYFPRN